MSFDLADWRAIAFGYGAAMATLALYGNGWHLPVVTIVVALAVRCVWR